MFGSLMVRFQAYMINALGEEEWKDLLRQAGQPEDKVYRSIKFYSDDEFDKLVEIACGKIGIDKDVLYKKLGLDFGRYLLKTYKVMFFPSWRALDVIEKAAPKVFKSIQYIDAHAPKSSVVCERVSPEEVIVHYQSERKMCPYILGIIDAMGEYFNEKLEVSHTKCQRYKGSECEIHVKLIKSNQLTSV